MSKYLSARGFRPLAVDLSPSDGTVALEELAAQLRTFVEQELPPGEPFDLIGFSMGGLVCRYYVQRLGGIERVGRLITISSPHRGTYWAYTTRNAGSRQMRPRSEFLRDLNRDVAVLERVRHASIWTPLDLMILPARSSRFGEDFQVLVGLHAWMVRSRKCFAVVAEILNSPASASLVV
jgi:triacylglycerol lipase